MNPLHRLDALFLLVGQTLLASDDKDAHAGGPEATSQTFRLGGLCFSRAAIPTGRSIQGPVGRWM